LGQKTPDVVYKTAMGGGAMIVDKYQQRLNRGSADQLRLKLKVQLKLSGFLS
jgi:hypothetical protein